MAGKLLGLERRRRALLCDQAESVAKLTERIESRCCAENGKSADGEERQQQSAPHTQPRQHAGLALFNGRPHREVAFHRSALAEAIRSRALRYPRSAKFVQLICCLRKLE